MKKATNKTGKRTFSVSKYYDFDKVDFWWATMLKKSVKEVSDIKWSSNGNGTWSVTFHWSEVQVSGGMLVKIGTPGYSSFKKTELEMNLEFLQEELDIISETLKTYEDRLVAWDVKLSNRLNVGGLDGSTVDLEHSDTLGPLDIDILHNYVWPNYLSLRDTYHKLQTTVSDLKYELKAREDPNYLPTAIDRGMLRSSYQSEFGFDNPTLFSDPLEDFSRLTDDGPEDHDI